MEKNSKVYILRMKKNMDATGGIVYSVIPAIIYSGLAVGRCFSGYSVVSKIAVVVLLAIGYLIASMLPYTCFLTAIGNVIMLTGLVWVIINHIEVIWLNITFKIITAGMISLTELGVCVCIMEGHMKYRK